MTSSRATTIQRFITLSIRRNAEDSRSSWWRHGSARKRELQIGSRRLLRIVTLGPKYAHGFCESLVAGYERRSRTTNQQGLPRFAHLISSILSRRRGLIESHALLPLYSMCQWRPSPLSMKGDNGSN